MPIMQSGVPTGGPGRHTVTAVSHLGGGAGKSKGQEHRSSDMVRKLAVALASAPAAKTRAHAVTDIIRHPRPQRQTLLSGFGRWRGLYNTVNEEGSGGGWDLGRVGVRPPLP